VGTAAAVGATAGVAAAQQQCVPLAALEAKIDEVMEACGFDHDASMTTLQKLAQLEVRPIAFTRPADVITYLRMVTHGRANCINLHRLSRCTNLHHSRFRSPLQHSGWALLTRSQSRPTL
jgi:hypothetical protein